MRIAKRPTIIESCHLSTGQLMQITKFGHKYSFMLASIELLVAPNLLLGLNKADAYNAYNTHLQADVLELD